MIKICICCKKSIAYEGKRKAPANLKYCRECRSYLKLLYVRFYNRFKRKYKYAKIYTGGV